jgi:uncharacterized protein YbaP (TraB family)
MSNPEIMEYYYEKMLLPDGNTLKSLLDTEVYELLETKVIGAGDSMDTYSKYRPFLVVNTLTQLNYKKHGFDQMGVDTFYFSKAKETGKELDFLEDIETQIDVLSELGEGYENDYVKNAFTDIDNIKSLVTLVSEVMNGVQTVTESMLYELKDKYPLFYEDLIYDRNMAWMPQIETYLTTDPVEFVLVGLSHLHGSDGLLHKLRTKGYTVTQLVN